MKKYLVLFFTATLLFSGCKQEPIEVGPAVSIQEAADSEKINESKGEEVEAADFKKIFDDAAKKSQDEDNVTITAEVKTIVSPDERSETYTGGSTIIEAEQNSVNKTKILKAFSDEKKEMNFSFSNQYDEATEQQNGFYSGDVSAYYDGENLFLDSKNEKGEAEKYQIKLTYDEVMQMTNNYSITVYEESVEQAKKETDALGNMKYIGKLNKEKFESIMAENLLKGGMQAKMEVNFANVIYKVDPEGRLVEYTFYLDASIDSGDIKNPYIYSVNCMYDSFGITKTTPIEDPDSYMTEEEYMEKTQAEEGSSEETTEGGN